VPGTPEVGLTLSDAAAAEFATSNWRASDRVNKTIDALSRRPSNAWCARMPNPEDRFSPAYSPPPIPAPFPGVRAVTPFSPTGETVTVGGDFKSTGWQSTSQHLAV
jgi:hypothetical protein